MKKKLYIGLGIFAGVLLAVYLVIVFGLGGFVTSAVNKYGPDVTKTPVHLTEAHLSPFSGEGSLDDLTVGNPPGWSQNSAFALKRIHISVVPGSILTNHIVVRELAIEGPEFHYETRITSSNIGTLVANIEGQQNNAASQAKTKSGEPIRFEIRHLVIKDASLVLVVEGARAVSLAMPPIELNNIGTDQGGITSGQLAAIISRTLLTSIVQSSGKALTKMVPAAGDILKGVGGGLQNLLHR